MSNSGSGSAGVRNGAAWVITDAYPEPVRIGDDEVRADEAERARVALDESVGFPAVEHGLHEPAAAHDRELLTLVAETHPGIVRTLSVLVGELTGLELEPGLQRGLGDRIRRIGDRVVRDADGPGGAPLVVAGPRSALEIKADFERLAVRVEELKRELAQASELARERSSSE